MTLKADIKYKSNWQQGTLKAQRRNKWICALKASLSKLHIYGPGGDPSPHTGPTKYTLVPYEEVLRQEEEAKHSRQQTSDSRELHIPKSDWTFADPNSAVGVYPDVLSIAINITLMHIPLQLVDDSQDVFGEGSQLYMPRPQQTLSGTPRSRPAASPAMPSSVTMPAAMVLPQVPMTVTPQPMGMEEIELRTPRADQLSHNV